MQLDTNLSEVEIAHREAYALDGSSEGMEYIGATENNGRVYIYWKDENQKYWFQKKFRVEDKLISEEEYIFGRKLKMHHKKRQQYGR